ncbi:hypothetical protein TrVFT333_009218 [Trichoderma virens FT-333]|nr:hypothetical protein TrVFT333_009218 [Trichoderma virens FT-333]
MTDAGVAIYSPGQCFQMSRVRVQPGLMLPRSREATRHTVVQMVFGALAGIPAHDVFSQNSQQPANSQPTTWQCAAARTALHHIPILIFTPPRPDLRLGK